DPLSQGWPAPPKPEREARAARPRRPQPHRRSRCPRPPPARSSGAIVPAHSAPGRVAFASVSALETRTIPWSWYTDPAVLALEQERIFRHSWQYVARQD